MDHAYSFWKAKGALEAYRVRGHCLEPDICPGDNVVVDRGYAAGSGDFVLCPNGRIGRLQQVEGQPYLVTNEGSERLSDLSGLAPIVEVAKRFK
jgi:hypothetical protein